MSSLSEQYINNIHSFYNPEIIKQILKNSGYYMEADLEDLNHYYNEIISNKKNSKVSNYSELSDKMLQTIITELIKQKNNKKSNSNINNCNTLIKNIRGGPNEEKEEIYKYFNNSIKKTYYKLYESSNQYVMVKNVIDIDSNKDNDILYYTKILYFIISLKLNNDNNKLLEKLEKQLKEYINYDSEKSSNENIDIYENINNYIEYKQYNNDYYYSNNYFVEIILKKEDNNFRIIFIYIKKPIFLIGENTLISLIERIKESENITINNILKDDNTILAYNYIDDDYNLKKIKLKHDDKYFKSIFERMKFDNDSIKYDELKQNIEKIHNIIMEKKNNQDTDGFDKELKEIYNKSSLRIVNKCKDKYKDNVIKNYMIYGMYLLSLFVN
tara:strand:+ start:154 stop:1308 length:1155 start_codon:yes stop_codon:yes gene_type:complete